MGNNLLLKHESRRINIIGGLLLALLMLVAGMTVYTVMQRQAERILGNRLEASLRQDISQFENQITQGVTNTLTGSSRPFMIRNLKLHNAEPGNAVAKYELQQIAQSFLSSFTAVSLLDVRGNEVVRAGHFSQQPELRVALNTKDRVFLLWDGEFILNVSVDIHDQQGRSVGNLMTEAKLPALTRAISNVELIGKTGDLGVCALQEKDPGTMQCFPFMSARGKGTKRLPRLINNKTLPMSYALDGKAGIIFTPDYRQIPVAAAYAPIGSLGLGMVMKIDQTELFSPIADQIKPVWPILITLIIVGIVLLRWMMMPIVRKLISSEQELRVAATAFETREAIFITDQHRRIVQVNRAFTRLSGYSAEEMVGQTLSLFQPDTDHAESYQKMWVSVGRDKYYQGETQIKYKGGELFPI